MNNDNDIKAAFGHLITRYNGLIQRLCWLHSGGNGDRFLLLLDDCRLTLWRRQGTIRRDATEWQVRRWVIYQCHSVFSHHHRHRKRSWILLDDNLADLLPDSRDDDLRELVEELAEDLNKHERMVLALILEGYTTKEIAAKMNLKTKGVETLRFRMIKKMRETCKRKNLM